MANKKITDLQLISSIADSANWILDTGIQTYRATSTQLMTYIYSKLAALSSVTPQGVDTIMISDNSDSNNAKKIAVKNLRDAVIRAVTTTDSVGVDDETMTLSGASFVSTLPAIGSRPGKRYKYLHKGTVSQKYTINTTGGDTVGGLASGVFKLCTPGEVLEVEEPVSGTDWRIVGRVTDAGVLSTGAIVLSATAAYVFSWTGNQNIVQGDTYTDGAGNTYTVTTSANTTSGTFSGTPGTPASTGTLTRASGSGVSSIAWTSRTITGQPVVGTTSKNVVSVERRGRYALIDILLAQTGAGTAGSGDYIFYLPSGFVFDSTYTPYLTIGSSLQIVTAAWVSAIETLGKMTNNTDSGNGVMGFVYSTTSFRISLQGTSAGNNWRHDFFNLGATNCAAKITLKALMQDWQP